MGQNAIELRIVGIIHWGRPCWIFRRLVPLGVAEGLYRTDCILVNMVADVKRNRPPGAGLAISLEVCKRQKVYPKVHNNQTMQKAAANAK